MWKKVYVCEDSIIGLYSALYDAWRDGRDRSVEEVGIAFRGKSAPLLFCEYVDVEETERKARAVEAMLQKHLGRYASEKIYLAALSGEEDKGDAILGTMLAACRLRDSRRILDHLTEPAVERVFELSRRVGNEAHLTREFLRFRELKNGVLFARISPKSQILTCIAPHFADRFPLENWLIYDETHRIFAVHEAHKPWILAAGPDGEEEQFREYSKNEEEILRLWKGFFQTIAIKERENYACQRTHMPLWYRKHAVEFGNSSAITEMTCESCLHE